VAGLFDLFFGTPRRRRRRAGPQRHRRSAPRRSPRTALPRGEARLRRQREAAERKRDAAERREARLAAKAARRRVRQHERQSLLGQRMRLRALERQRREHERQLRREARMEQRARKEAARRMHPPRVSRKRTYEEIFGVNPRRRRNPATRSALSAAAGVLANPRRRRNPGLGSIVGEIAKDVVKGGLIAAAQEEAKEWRGRIHQGGWGYAVRAEMEEQRGKKRNNPPKRARTRKNPATLVPGHPDPKLQRMSEQFHGERGHILRLGPDQRRPLPEYVVDVGQEVATVYRPARSSQRGRNTWEHESGDVGGRKISGRRRIVADARGRTYVVPGSSRMRFDPRKGLVG
jgi:hypothetical protein